MSKPLFLSRARTSVLIGAGLLVAVSTVSAQPGIRTPRIRDRVLIPGQVLTTNVPLAQVKITPELRTYLVAQKPKVSAQLLEKSFVLLNGIPAFKLEDGSTRLLMLPNEGQGAATDTSAVPQELAEAKSYIVAPLKLGVSRLNALKLSPNYVLATGVDRRDKMTPIRDQGQRGTCVAFAANGALEPFASIPDDLSEQYTYHMCLAKDGSSFDFNKGTYTETAIDVLKAGTVQETAWPYSYSIPPANEAVPDSATSGAKYKATSSQFIGGDGLTGASIKNPNYLETILDKGYNIVYMTQVAWYGNHTNDVIDVVIDASTNQPAASRGNHEMVIVGYNSTKEYFIVRNSWGKYFGHDGYAYISYDYMRTYAINGFYIKGVSPSSMFTPNIGDRIKVTPRLRIPR